jgi:hypothetical protein
MYISGRRGHDRIRSWIYNYLCSQCLSPLMLRVRIPLRRGVLDTILCEQADRVFLRALRYTPLIKLTATL